MKGRYQKTLSLPATVALGDGWVCAVAEDRSGIALTFVSPHSGVAGTGRWSKRAIRYVKGGVPETVVLKFENALRKVMP
jgi:chemotaxis protein histidine kinase CheA